MKTLIRINIAMSIVAILSCIALVIASYNLLPFYVCIIGFVVTFILFMASTLVEGLTDTRA